MKLIAERDHLIAALTPAARIARPKSGIPILNHVLLQATGDRLTIMAHDLSACVSSFCVAQVDIEGSCAVPADALARLLGNMAKGSQVALQLNDPEISIRAGRSRYTLPILPASDFPAPLTPDDPVELQLTGEELIELFDATRPFVEKDGKTRPWLTGVHLREDKKHLIGEATDGARAMQRKIKFKVQGIKGFIVPERSVDAILDLGKENGARLICGAKVLSVNTETMTFATKLVDGTYPDIDRVLPPLAQGWLECDREELLAAVERLLVLDDDKRTLRIKWDKGAEYFTLSLRGAGEGAEEVAGEVFNLDSNEVGVGPLLLRDLLKAMPGEMLRVYSSDPGSAVRLGNPQREGVAAVLMPRRI